MQDNSTSNWYDICMDVLSICNLFKEMKKYFIDVQKWHHDMKTGQVFFRISVLFWEMYQREKLINSVVHE